MHACMYCFEFAYLSLNYMTHVAILVEIHVFDHLSSYETRMKVICHMHVRSMEVEALNA